MDRMKTFLIYALCIAGFFMLSNILININLESTYKPIERKDDINEIVINQAEATRVNGRIKGSIENIVVSKYIRIDLYSKRDILLGTKYIDILDLRSKKDFEIHFKLNDVKYYNISLTNEKDESVTEINLLDEDLSKSDILWGTFLLLIMI